MNLIAFSDLANEDLDDVWITIALDDSEAVSAEMALRLSRYCGTTAQLWLNLQSQYHLEVASEKIGKKVERTIRPLPLPLPDLAEPHPA